MIPPLPPRAADEPVRGWKAGVLLLHDSGAYGFTGAYTTKPYGLNAIAECPNSHVEGIPHDRCSCGFYAHAGSISRTGPLAFSATTLFDDVGVTRIPVFLEVELYGKVIVGSTGYRGEKQRIMRVLASRKALIPQCSAGLAATTDYPVSLACGRNASFFMEDGPKPRALLCGEHAIAYSRKFNRRFYELPTASEVQKPDIPVDWEWLD